MKITVYINSANVVGGVSLELPDGYNIGPRLWHDVQDLLIEQLLRAKEAGQVVDFITGLNGDPQFRAQMDALGGRT